ncbi:MULTISPECIES: protein-ADP-ribose hydrolase [unclassified Streptococcus]|uniref:protein-ADP-ribose hydrolase n=1 Tax=unclassified Streptococcus TaxID=2608887 RepID=UPI0010726A8E|nr:MULTISPECIES: protein-ADP-ribose hydrolase [unclassified Streptococcus]MBF0787355.1 protein-ADP-ribose hydrolase [Streptococcus sp. 19428wC2_LYSM12]MCQ9211107.1 protein-ADP-ribose hydrolase [Streptococcus sp. B01]MCQ9214382.1 protein-ADP-ribose hydrolase [Streptococcus sp. O1]TFV05700.1 protein-ADP-ribose hydrolase [Streptococcus sp. LYSM12]
MHKEREFQLLREMILLLGGKEVMLEHKEELVRVWRGLVNQRPAGPISQAYLTYEQEFLTAYHEKHQCSLEACEETRSPHILLYYGDICHLQVDAIVNAANSDLQGCFIPNHTCIDNAIHFYAGMELRNACAELMKEQGHREPVGQVKVTAGYALPARFIFHTVGPRISVGKRPSLIREHLLRQCYLSCLNQARKKDIRTIAFCAISTGEFGYPKEEAAYIAVQTVRDWLQETGYELTVIFTLYTAEDACYYEEELGVKEKR